MICEGFFFDPNERLTGKFGDPMPHIHWRSKFSRLALGAVFVIGCAEAVICAAGDWPQWRGPRRDDVSTETGLLKDWPTGGPPLVWETKGLGGASSGYSTVSISNGKIFATGSFPSPPGDATEKPEPKTVVKPGPKSKAIPIDETTSVIALDLTGKILWTTQVGPTTPMDSPEWTGARGAPTVDGDRVYSLADSGDLVCLAVNDGKAIWRVNLKKDLRGAVGQWAYTESPVIEGDKLICCPGGSLGTLAVLDKKTGAVLWRSKGLTDGASYSSLVPADINGVHQYVVMTPGSVAGVGTDGSLLWKIARASFTYAICTPVVKDNLVFVTGRGACNAYKIEGAGSAMKAIPLFESKDMKVLHGGVIVIGDDVFGCNDPGLLTCMSLKDGSVVWKDRSIGKGSLTFADDRLYFRAEATGDVALIEASHMGYKEHGVLKQPHRSKRSAWAHPVISGGKLYLRDQDTLLCYDVKAK